MFEGLARGGIPGGQLMITNDVENYPGFPEKIAGPDLMKAFREQSVHQGCEIVTEDVNKVDFSKRPFRVWAGDDNDEHTAETLIIATGAQAKWLGIESEHALKGQGRHAPARSATAPSSATRTSWSSAAATRRWKSRCTSPASAVRCTLVHRRDEFRASKTMQDRVLENPKIQRRLQHGVIDEVLDVSKGEVTGVRAEGPETGKERVGRRSPGFFVAIGHTPNTDLFTGQLDLHDNGYIRTKPGTTQTSVPGRLRRGRRAGLRLPPGRHRRGHRLHGGARGGALARRRTRASLAAAAATGIVAERTRASAENRSLADATARSAKISSPRSPFFDGLTREALSLIAQVTTEESHALGTRIFQYGDPGDKLFIILEGKVRISREVAGMGEEALAVLGPGQVFGEMALLDESPRSADARAHERCRLLVITKDAFDDLLFMHKDLAYEVLWAACAMLSARLRETNDKLTFLSTSGKF